VAGTYRAAGARVLRPFGRACTLPESRSGRGLLEAGSHTSRRIAVLVAGGALLALVGGSQSAAVVTQVERPNIVVIETDDQTMDSLRYMENVQRLLVKQGVRFDNSFSSYPLCCPSRATFLTGQYAHNHGVRGNNPPLGGYVALDHSNTLPVWLQAAGYHTSFVGKYLNGYGEGEGRTEVPPGWDDWRAAVRTPGKATLSYVGFTLNENRELVDYAPTQANYQTDVFTRKAVAAIERRAPAESPFFLWLAYFAPHSGLPVDEDDKSAPGVHLSPSPAARHRDAFSTEALPVTPSFDEADVSDKSRLVRNLGRLSFEQQEALQQAYQQRLESLLAVDEGVAQIVQALRGAGELSRTLIVFTSDNGFMHGEHRVLPDRGKGWPYEASVRVPLVLRGLGLPHGRRVQDLVSNADLAPTLLHAARATPDRVVDGRSLLPLARDPLADYGRDLLLASNIFTAIRTDRYVYVVANKVGRELYDVKADPDQLRSRHRDPKLTKVKYELARRLNELSACFGENCREDPLLRLRLAPLGGSVRADVAGADAPWVAATRFYVNGRRVAARNRAPFRAVLAPKHFTSGTATVRVHVETTDGRGVTITRTIRIGR
jgi:N-acetylglucosamine-6-sulfatase